MISIITPVYNAERFLYKTADCILKQTYKNFQWILINDGSYDLSGQICDELVQKDKRIAAIHQHNQGVSAARNKGLQIANGEWVVFLDADDEVRPNWLQIYHDAIKPHIDLIFQGVIIRNHNYERIINLKNSIISTNELIDLWQNKYHEIGSAWSKMVKTSFIKEHHIYFETDLNNFEDWVFLTKCLCHSKSICLVNGCGYIYNHQNSSLTNNVRRSADDTYRIVYHWLKVLNLLKAGNIEGYEIILPYFSFLLIQTIIEFYKDNRKNESQRRNLLFEYKNIEINNKKLSIPQKITNFIWFRKYPKLSNKLLSIWRIHLLLRHK